MEVACGTTCPSRCQNWYGLPLPAVTIQTSPVSLLFSSPNALTCRQHVTPVPCMSLLVHKTGTALQLAPTHDC